MELKKPTTEDLIEKKMKLKVRVFIQNWGKFKRLANVQS